MDKDLRKNLIKSLKEKTLEETQLIESVPVEWKTYFDTRKTYREKLFRNKYDDSLRNILGEFNNLVNGLSDSELRQFILFTSKQDIVVFCEFTIEEIRTLPENKLTINIKNKYDNLLKKASLALSENVNKYINRDRFRYKERLYHGLHCDVDNFKEINNTYNTLISNLDEDTKKIFVNA
ncbi:33596_t:CDS:1, partial [Racocetra persica]